MRKKKKFDESKKDNAPAVGDGAEPDFQEITAKPVEEVNEENVEKTAEEVSEETIEKTAEEVNEASTPSIKKPLEEGNEAPSPEIDPPVGDISSNNVDTPTPGTEIVLTTNDPEVLDATLEEPGYPAYEWQEKPELPPIVPNDAMTDENLVAFILARQGLINNRSRKSNQDYWLIGNGLHVLFQRHDVETVGTDGKKIMSRWREDWLPRLGYNHTTDQQLRAMATELTFEEAGLYPNKTRALQALGFSVGGVKKAIEHDKKERAQEINKGGNELVMPEPLDEGVIEVAPQKGANHQPVAKGKPEPKVGAKATAEHKIAAKVAPQAEPEEDDPIAVGEALVVTLGGAKVAEIEAALSESQFAVVARTEKRVVGLLWFAEDDYDPAKDKVGKALEKLRDVKKNFLVEARFLRPLEVIAL